MMWIDVSPQAQRTYDGQKIAGHLMVGGGSCMLALAFAAWFCAK